MDYGKWLSFVVFAMIFAGGFSFVLMVSYDFRRYPLCKLCGDNVHTLREKIFDRHFNCGKHGRQIS